MFNSKKIQKLQQRIDEIDQYTLLLSSKVETISARLKSSTEYYENILSRYDSYMKEIQHNYELIQHKLDSIKKD